MPVVYSVKLATVGVNEWVFNISRILSCVLWRARNVVVVVFSCHRNVCIKCVVRGDIFLRFW